MDAVPIEADQVEGVPFTVWLFAVHEFYAPISDRQFLHEERRLPRGLIVPEVAFAPCVHGDLRAERVEVARIVFLDLKLDRAWPRRMIKARLAVHKIEQAGVAGRVDLVAPL